MPVVKKPAKAPKAKVAKPKVIKAKPASTAKKAPVTKPKAISKAPKALKVAIKAPVETKVRKVRGPNKIKAKGSFADLLKKQAELEQVKKGAKAELKKQFEDLIKESEKVKAQYQELFHELLLASAKSKSTAKIAKKTTGKIVGLKPFSLKEVEDFIDQKKEGVDIKIKGRRPKSIARLEAAYSKSDDANTILRILNQ
jgi:hypothetical protein